MHGDFVIYNTFLHIDIFFITKMNFFKFKSTNTAVMNEQFTVSAGYITYIL